jgi:peptidoglycan/LPS O-acetylase OafA/YrhL
VLSTLALAFLLTVITAAASYYVVERPMLAFKDALRGGSSRPRAQLR